MHCSPMPIQTMSGLVSETATAPTDELVIWPSVTGTQVSPPSVGLPQSAAGLPEIGFLRPSLHAARRDRSAGAIRPDAAPLVGLQDCRIDRTGSGGGGLRRSRARRDRESSRRQTRARRREARAKGVFARGRVYNTRARRIRVCRKCGSTIRSAVRAARPNCCIPARSSRLRRTWTPGCPATRRGGSSATRQREHAWCSTPLRRREPIARAPSDRLRPCGSTCSIPKRASTLRS